MLVDIRTSLNQRFSLDDDATIDFYRQASVLDVRALAFLGKKGVDWLSGDGSDPLSFKTYVKEYVSGFATVDELKSAAPLPPAAGGRRKSAAAVEEEDDAAAFRVPGSSPFDRESLAYFTFAADWIAKTTPAERCRTDIVALWKKQAPLFPIHNRAFRALTCVWGANGGVEGLFSASGSIERPNMGPKLLEALVMNTAHSREAAKLAELNRKPPVSMSKPFPMPFCWMLRESTLKLPADASLQPAYNARIDSAKSALSKLLGASSVATDAVDAVDEGVEEEWAAIEAKDEEMGVGVDGADLVIGLTELE